MRRAKPRPRHSRPLSTTKISERFALMTNDAYKANHADRAANYDAGRYDGLKQAIELLDKS
jgi:hypothetical protein